jgi:hypothetical protein
VKTDLFMFFRELLCCGKPNTETHRNGNVLKRGALAENAVFPKAEHSQPIIQSL